MIQRRIYVRDVIASNSLALTQGESALARAAESLAVGEPSLAGARLLSRRRPTRKRGRPPSRPQSALQGTRPKLPVAPRKKASAANFLFAVKNGQSRPRAGLLTELSRKARSILEGSRSGNIDRLECFSERMPIWWAICFRKPLRGI